LWHLATMTTRVWSIPIGKTKQVKFRKESHLNNYKNEYLAYEDKRLVKQVKHGKESQLLKKK